jgi:spore coat protein CotF
MDPRLSEALSFSNYQNTLSTQRKILREKLNSSLLYGYNGGIFKVDESLISFTQLLASQNRSNLPILDSNKNPILIQDMKYFLDEILNVYFSAVLDYYNEYEKIKKSRSVEKLVDYE